VLFRQLEYFVAVARERHFARAACYVSQPALGVNRQARTGAERHPDQPRAQL
jgi:DNA-binding transcriptional LysR family regulator